MFIYFQCYVMKMLVRLRNKNHLAKVGKRPDGGMFCQLKWEVNDSLEQ